MVGRKRRIHENDNGDDKIDLSEKYLPNGRKSYCLARREIARLRLGDAQFVGQRCPSTEVHQLPIARESIPSHIKSPKRRVRRASIRFVVSDSDDDDSFNDRSGQDFPDSKHISKGVNPRPTATSNVSIASTAAKILSEPPKHRAVVPEGWIYTPCNCTNTWRKWFHGSKREPPLRFIHLDDIDDMASKQRLLKTTILMKELIAATGLSEDVIAEMDNSALLKTLNKAFEKRYPSKDPGRSIAYLSISSNNVDMTALLPSCSELWNKWFTAKPVRWSKLATEELPSEMQPEHDRHGKFIAKLSQIAVNLGLVESEEAVERLTNVPSKALFVLVFQAFVAQCGPKCRLTPQSSCQEAHAWLDVELDPSFRLDGKPFFPFLSLRTMWCRWYLGHIFLTYGAPYCRPNLWHEDSVDFYTKTKRSIEALVQTAVEYSIVKSKSALEAIKDEDALLKVFDQTLAIFKEQFVDEVKPRVHELMFSYTIVHHLEPSVWMQHPKFGQATSKKAKKKPNVLVQPANKSTATKLQAPPVVVRSADESTRKNPPTSPVVVRPADKSTRTKPLAPPVVVRPADESTPCRTMWWLWFRGDERSNFVPFRRTTGQLKAPIAVMKALEELILEESLAPSLDAVETMDDKTLTRLFEEAFLLFATTFDPSVQSWIQPATMCHVVKKHMTPALWRRHPNADQA